MLMTRRLMVAGIGGLAGTSLIPRFPVAATGGRSEMRFAAFRNGSSIGSHRLALREQDGRQLVTVDIRLDVKFGPLPLYRYRHSNREVWVDGRLHQLDSRTDDNGTEHRVLARAGDRKLTVEGSAGRLELPPDTFTTTYWNETGIRTGEWLDTQSGRLVRSEVTAHPAEPIVAGGRTLEANRYTLSGDLECDVWYHAGCWAKLVFTAPDGSTIEYVKEPDPGDAA